MTERRWRFTVHADGQYCSISDGVTGDTILKVGGNPGASGEGDTAKAREFEEWLADLADLRELRARFGEELDRDADFVYGTPESATRQFFDAFDALLPPEVPHA